MKPTAQSVNIIDGTINGHGVKFVFYYQPTKADMANAHHATKNLENNLRDGVAFRKAHLFQPSRKRRHRIHRHFNDQLERLGTTKGGTYRK
jgi:hypothetical protein